MRQFFFFGETCLSSNVMCFTMQNQILYFLLKFYFSCFFGHSQLIRSLLVVLVKFPLGTFSDTLSWNTRFWKFNIIDKFIAVFLTFLYFSVLSSRRRCIDVLTLIAGYANPLRSKILFLQSGVPALAPCSFLQTTFFKTSGSGSFAWPLSHRTVVASCLARWSKMFF